VAGVGGEAAGGAGGGAGVSEAGVCGAGVCGARTRQPAGREGSERATALTGAARHGCGPLQEAQRCRQRRSARRLRPEIREGKRRRGLAQRATALRAAALVGGAQLSCAGCPRLVVSVSASATPGARPWSLDAA
jgi:hypothetical protein